MDDLADALAALAQLNYSRALFLGRPESRGRSARCWSAHQLATGLVRPRASAMTDDQREALVRHNESPYAKKAAEPWKFPGA